MVNHPSQVNVEQTVSQGLHFVDMCTNFDVPSLGASEYFKRTENIAGVKVRKVLRQLLMVADRRRTCDFKR